MIRARRRRRRSRRRNGFLTAGFIGGVVAGLVIWSVQMRRSRRDLFSASPVKRLAALGYIGAQPADGPATLQLIEDYVRWEKQPILRQRAERLLQRMRRHLV